VEAEEKPKKKTIRARVLRPVRRVVAATVPAERVAPPFTVGDNKEVPVHVHYNDKKKVHVHMDPHLSKVKHIAHQERVQNIIDIVQSVEYDRLLSSLFPLPSTAACFCCLCSVLIVCPVIAFSEHLKS
jgi:hypothetical protein